VRSSKWWCHFSRGTCVFSRPTFVYFCGHYASENRCHVTPKPGMILLGFDEAINQPDTFNCVCETPLSMRCLVLLGAFAWFVTVSENYGILSWTLGMLMMSNMGMQPPTEMGSWPWINHGRWDDFPEIGNWARKSSDGTWDMFSFGYTTLAISLRLSCGDHPSGMSRVRLGFRFWHVKVICFA